jgi:dihydrofolate reductase
VIRAIVSVDENWAIGYKGSLAVKNRADMAHFKSSTMGGTVVMGRRTLETLPGGRPLAGRRNIVLTRDPSFRREGVEVAHGLRELKNLLSEGESVWIIGGESVYRELLSWCSEALVTKNRVAVGQVDAWFPNLDNLPTWEVAEITEGGVTDDGIAFDYYRYRSF